MANANWNTFRIFDGLCTLDPSIFKNETTVRATATRFHTWIKNLHNLLNQNAPCGIPAAQREDVISLLKGFFPPVQQDQPPAFVDVRSVPQDLPEVGVAADPIKVTFGDGELLINDGPSALGYIFSVAEAPQAGPPLVRTWDSYVVPLLAIYARALYMAYVARAKPPPHAMSWDTAIANVPFMSGAMYFTSAANQLHVLLSSTYLPGRTDEGWDEALSDAKQLMMNEWRAMGALEPALQFYQPPRTMPPPTYPVAPIVMENICKGILKILQNDQLSLANSTLRALPGHIPALPSNTANPWETMSPALVNTTFDAAATALRAAWLNMNPTRPVILLPRAEIWDRRLWGIDLHAQLRTALAGVYNTRWNVGYDRNQPAIDEAFRAVFKVYFMPHLLAAALVPSQPPEDITPTIPIYQAQCDLVFAALYVSNRKNILDMLDRLHYWATINDAALAYGGPHVQRFGRCCETYPVAGLMPGYTPDRTLPAEADNPQPHTTAPSQVRGFSFQTREFRYTDALASNFSAATLNDLHVSSRNRIYRRPCRNCKALLPWFDVPIDTGPGNLQQSYYHDLNQLDPLAVDNVPDDPLIV